MDLKARPIGRRAVAGRGLLAAAVVVAAIGAGLLGLSAGGSRARAATGGVPGASGLIARLAVLQRAQAPTDQLPAGLNFGGVGPPAFIQSQTRLLGQMGAVRVYLVVTMAPHSGTPLWSPDLGDQAALLLVDGSHAEMGFAVPAAELDDDSFFTPLDAVTGSAQGGAAQLVPDGVARVGARYVTTGGRSGSTASATVQNNLAFLAPAVPTDLPRSERFGLHLRASWYGADGSVVPASDRGYRRALAARQAAERRRELGAAERSRVRAPGSLLRAFSVFAVHGARGVTRDGETASAPPLRSVPSWVLGLYGQPRPRGVSPVLRDLRRVRTPDGHIVWVVPAAHGLCMAVVTPSGLPGARGAAAHSTGGSCTPNIAGAERAGVGVGISGRIQIGVLPAAHPTVRLWIRGRVRTLRPPFGVYYETDAHRVR